MIYVSVHIYIIPPIANKFKKIRFTHLGSMKNITTTLNHRVQIIIGNQDIELNIKSVNRFGIFGSNNPTSNASIVSHDWFHPFDGQVKFDRIISAK